MTWSEQHFAGREQASLSDAGESHLLTDDAVHRKTGACGASTPTQTLPGWSLADRDRAFPT